MDLINENPLLDAKDLAIVARLKGNDRPQSGEAIAASLGISRVALWKRIEALKLLGYAIAGEKRGYRLLSDDAVLAQEFDHPETVVYRPHIPSTMDEAWRLAETGADSGTMVVADSQSAGRGQNGRFWASPSGGLYMTLILRPALPLSHAGAIVIESAAQVSRIVRERTGLELEYRWPNDLMLENSKVGGLLVEASGSPEKVRYFNLGLGLNFKSVELAERKTAGIAEFTDHRPKRRDIASALQNAMREWSLAPVLVPGDWYRTYRGAGKTVRGTDWTGRQFQGRVEGFTAQGAIVLDSEILHIGETKIIRFEGEEG